MKIYRLRTAFSLIELLVVIAVISILAALLLPALSRAKERPRAVQCLNNLHQIAIGVTLYTADNRDHFPSSEMQEDNGDSKSVKFGIGGNDPEPEFLPISPSARIRPLFPYLKRSEVFRCPKDHGVAIALGQNGNVVLSPVPSCWETLGCSYVYNTGEPPSYATMRPLASEEGLADKPSSWVPDASRYILMYEPPAGTLNCGWPKSLHRHLYATDWEYQFWHYSSDSRANVERHSLESDGRRFWSPLLFVDGHVCFFDFTKTIDASDEYICEPAPDWIWYKPKPDSTNNVASN